MSCGLDAGKEESSANICLRFLALVYQMETSIFSSKAKSPTGIVGGLNYARHYALATSVDLNFRFRCLRSTASPPPQTRLHLARASGCFTQEGKFFGQAACVTERFGSGSPRRCPGNHSALFYHLYAIEIIRQGAGPFVVKTACSSVSEGCAEQTMTFIQAELLAPQKRHLRFCRGFVHRCDALTPERPSFDFNSSW